MGSRRSFLQKLSCVFLLAYQNSYACMGQDRDFPAQTIVKNNRDLSGESLKEFLDSALGHTNWRIDKNQGVTVGKIDTSSPVLPIRLTIPSTVSNYYCEKIHIFVEQTLAWEPQPSHRAPRLALRDRVATFVLSDTIKVTNLEIRISPIETLGRLICAADFLSPDIGNQPITFVTFSEIPRRYCSFDRVLVESEEIAINSCEQIRLQKERFKEPRDEMVEQTVRACYRAMEYRK